MASEDASAHRWSFGRLSEIEVEEPRTWRGRIFVSFDLDFASDDVVEATLERVARAGVPATWFATHDTPILAAIRDNPLFELGIHPDFERLLWDENEAADAVDVLEEMRAFVPEAASVRSHYLTQSSALSALMAAHGIRVESNVHIPFTSQITLRPWAHPAGHVAAPFGWCDDVAASSPGRARLTEALQPEGLNVLVFHPVHVVANTATPSQLGRVLEVLRRPVSEVRAAARESGAEGKLGSAEQLDEVLALARFEGRPAPGVR